MQDKRSTGLILMGLAVAAFLGSTSEALPPEAFFPALALFAIGAVIFFKSSRKALAEADRQTQAKLHPTLRENRSALAAAERQAMRRGAALSSLNADLPGPTRPSPRSTEARRSATGSTDPRLQPDVAEIELLDVQEEELQITQDVSFPLEIQRGDALADQLRKLNQLLTQGILTEQEYAIAKAKLLG